MELKRGGPGAERAEKSDERSGAVRVSRKTSGTWSRGCGAGTERRREITEINVSSKTVCSAPLRCCAAYGSL